MKRKQVGLIVISLLIAIALIAASVSYWWVWAVWSVVLLAQVAKGLALDEKIAPARYVPPYAARRAIREQFAEIDAEHEAKVQDWLDRQAK